MRHSNLPSPVCPSIAKLELPSKIWWKLAKSVCFLIVAKSSNVPQVPSESVTHHLASEWKYFLMSANGSLDLILLPQHLGYCHHSLPIPTPREKWLCSMCGKIKDECISWLLAGRVTNYLQKQLVWLLIQQFLSQYKLYSQAIFHFVFKELFASFGLWVSMCTVV